MKPEEDAQLARLYDYTKFHIGIYLSFAAGISALLGTEKMGWFVSNLVGANKDWLYASLTFMVLAGMCGGTVASSTVECKTFEEFWSQPQGPQSIRYLRIAGKSWAMLEHLFFWVSLLLLSYAVAYGFSNNTPDKKAQDSSSPIPVCCCPQAAAVLVCPTK